jgi:hypothetical protein
MGNKDPNSRARVLLAEPLSAAMSAPLSRGSMASSSSACFTVRCPTTAAKGYPTRREAGFAGTPEPVLGDSMGVLTSGIRAVLYIS